MGDLFDSQEVQSVVTCVALCVATSTCLSVYFDVNSGTCNLNNNFIPQNILDPSYNPTGSVDILGWDPRGLVSSFSLTVPMLTM